MRKAQAGLDPHWAGRFWGAVLDEERDGGIDPKVGAVLRSCGWAPGVAVSEGCLTLRAGRLVHWAAPILETGAPGVARARGV